MRGTVPPDRSPIPPPIAPPVTRLAPSPTGALHLGNARTFLVTWALARRQGWRILLRIEDLDSPRVKAGAEAEITRTLKWLGMDWDSLNPAELNVPGASGAGAVSAQTPGSLGRGAMDSVLVQSEDLSAYRDAMRALSSKGLAYPCTLTRAQIESAASAPQDGAHDTPFPHELRPRSAGTPINFDAPSLIDGEPPNWRFVCPPGDVTFVDAFAGPQRIDPSRTIGDFVLWTKRGQPSYQLAVVVDDHRQGVTHVIRGDDLLDSAARQLRLWRALGYAKESEPIFMHLPLVLGADGKRLAKRHGDTRVEHYREKGVEPERIVGLIGAWSGIGDRRRPEPLSAEGFMDAFTMAKLPPEPVVFTPEDDQWLRNGSM